MASQQSADKSVGMMQQYIGQDSQLNEPLQEMQ